MSVQSELMELEINGEAKQVKVGAGEMLSDVLRYQLGLTGTKISCEEAECGTCTVLVDGQPVLSCVYPALKASGRSVRSIEGLSENGHLHPLQEAFVKHGAVQCGFCIPGQIMTASALLERNPDPSEAEIRCVDAQGIPRSFGRSRRHRNRCEPASPSLLLRCLPLPIPQSSGNWSRDPTRLLK